MAEEMTLTELAQAYKARKQAYEAAQKEEEKYKKLLKEAMEKAGKKAFTDEEGYTFERIPSQRKKLDEDMLLKELHERKLEDCIGFKEIVDEDATLEAVEHGRLPQAVLNKCLVITPIVTLKLTAPKKGGGKK